MQTNRNTVRKLALVIPLGLAFAGATLPASAQNGGGDSRHHRRGDYKWKQAV